MFLFYLISINFSRQNRHNLQCGHQNMLAQSRTIHRVQQWQLYGQGKHSKSDGLMESRTELTKFYSPNLQSRQAKTSKKNGLQKSPNSQNARTHNVPRKTAEISHNTKTYHQIRFDKQKSPRLRPSSMQSGKMSRM